MTNDNHMPSSALFTAHGGRLDHYSQISGRQPEDIVDFSVNVNPNGLPDFLRAAVHRTLHTIDAYPHPYAASAVFAAAEFHAVPPEQIVFGNGTSQLIQIIPRALGLKEATIHIPAFSEYENACAAYNTRCHYISSTLKDGTPDVASLIRSATPHSAVFVTTPGNPTALAIPPQRLREAAQLRPDVWLIIDEAFIDYAPKGYSLLSEKEPSLPGKTGDTLADQQNQQTPALPDNCIVLRSLTKFYGAAGLRTGYAVCSQDAATRIRAELPEWSLNGFAIAVTEAMFSEGRRFRADTHTDNIRRRTELATVLTSIAGVQVFPSNSNFLLIRTPEHDDLFHRMLLNHGIAIRDCRNFRSLEDGTYYRVAVRNDKDNEHLYTALCNELAQPAGTKTSAQETQRRVTPVKKPALMLQGTSSDAGKSILTAAFCRILRRQGYRVAPFKSQNMALNSHVTPSGGEIGRAQAVQAQACRIEPDPRMNPVLLKPNTDTGSQVIVMGKAKGNMSVREYFSYKKEAFSIVKDAYDSLADEYDVLILEGAGSPGEVNLKAHDIVNMNMARYADSPVLLTGDIDRGGVYASFLGTVATFDRWEHDLLAGFLINRFRGDANLLHPAHEYIQAYTRKPVLGVIPHIENLGLPEEDSVSMHLGNTDGKDDDSLDVALIILPRLSNFTDFNPLECEPDVKLRLVRTVEELGSPDVIIIPGSKSVIGDLTALKERGLDTAICRQAERCVWIIGICGGLQMLGRSISDPLGIESSTPAIAGLGLIGLETTMQEQKTLTNLQQVLVSSHTALPLLPAATGETNFPVHGYEIHHGTTRPDADVTITMKLPHAIELGSAVGFAQGTVWTTYLHGVFDDDAFRRSFIDALRVQRGLSPAGRIRASYDTEKALDRLANVVENAVDLEQIIKRIGL